MAQQKYDDAEQSFKNALNLNPCDEKDSPEMAAALANLGGLYHEEKRNDLAREYAERSVALYQKKFKVASQNSGARQSLGQPIAYQSWMLSELALQQHQSGDAIKYCRTVVDFQEFLKPADHDLFVPSCIQTISNSEKK